MNQKSSMPIYFPDEASRKAVMEANCITDKTISDMMNECRSMLFSRMVSAGVVATIVSAIACLIIKIGIVFPEDLIPVQEVFELFAGVFLWSGVICTILGLLFALLLKVSYRMAKQLVDKVPVYPYDVDTGSFVGYKMKTNRAGNVQKNFVVMYKDSHGKIRKAYSDVANLVMFKRTSKSSPVRIVSVTSWGIRYTKVFVEDFFCFGEVPKPDAPIASIGDDHDYFNGEVY